MDDTAEQERIIELFGYGRAGELIPAVDPEDVKIVWEIAKKVSRAILKETLRLAWRFSDALASPRRMLQQSPTGSAKLASLN